MLPAAIVKPLPTVPDAVATMPILLLPALPKDRVLGAEVVPIENVLPTYPTPV